ncbi:MAG: ATP-dependent Clp protease proteolytic subunit [Verrucomicrobia subdivision 3 bacterium]|nr:ATP-dependent Clp protease proteolytic subunit [Limisphaerales bacterium]
MPNDIKWYSIRARAAQPRAAEVLIYGDIGESWWGESVLAKDFVQEIAALDVDELTVRINSYGGSVSDGIAIHNAIKRHPAHVTVSIDGVAASIASLIAMAGDSVEMAENSLLMIHAPWGAAMGNSADLRDFADMLDTWAEAMATSYAAKTGRPVAEMQALLTDGEDHWYTAAEALAEKFIDATVAALPLAASFDRAALAHRFRSLPAQPAESGPAAAAAPLKEKSMPEKTTAAAPEQTVVTEAEVQARVLAADRQRRTDIETAYAKFKADPAVATLMKSCQDDTACTAEQANAKLLAHLGQSAGPVAGGYVVTVEDERDKFRAAAVESIMARAAARDDKGAVVRINAANPLRGHKLIDLARACLTRAGIKTDGMSQMEVVAAAFTQSTSDFPVLLENTMHKTLQNAYAVAALTWRRFCNIGSVSDFRASNRYRVGSLSNLDSINELGEFKNKTIPDGEKSSITAGTKGNIINLSRQAVINDDLGAFVGLAAALGRAAGRTIEADVYALLALNGGLGPTMSDTYTLFHANHNNITTTAAISMAALDLDRVALASQKDVGGNDYLDLVPAVLLTPMSLGGTARGIIGAEYDPDTTGKLQKPNIVKNMVRDVVDSPRLTGTRRYLFADPGEAPVLEVAFLDGQQDPYLELQDGFDVDGARYKVRLDFGTAAIDYRGAVTNAG